MAEAAVAVGADSVEAVEAGEAPGVVAGAEAVAAGTATAGIAAAEAAVAGSRATSLVNFELEPGSDSRSPVFFMACLQTLGERQFQAQPIE